MKHAIGRLVCYQYIASERHVIVNDEWGEVDMATEYIGEYLAYPYLEMPIFFESANGSNSHIYLNYFSIPTQ